MRFLHLAIDDKFTNFSIEAFEREFPGRNSFRVKMGAAGRRGFVRPSPCVRLVSRRYWFDGSLMRDLAQADCLVVHFMTPWLGLAVLRAPAALPIVWAGWGGDYCSLIPVNECPYLPLTAGWLAERRSRWRGDYWKRSLFEHTARWLMGDWLRRVAERVDFISMLPEEYDALAARWPLWRARYHQLYCSTAEDYLGHEDGMIGPDILVGNSATPTCNHLDAFSVLRDLDLHDRRIVVPLSYGDPEYADAVATAGRQMFGDRFVPLLQFLPMQEYYALIARCGTLIMNHVRQQGCGLAAFALASGARVLLRKENLLYDFFVNRGADITPLPAGTGAVDAKLLDPLDSAQRSRNRAAIARYWDPDVVFGQISALERRIAQL